jgi:phage FluMu protein Com
MLNFHENDYIELECPFCKQDQWFNYKLEHFEDCYTIGHHHKEYRARAIQWINNQLENWPDQKS